MTLPGVVGLWEPAMETLSLMIVSVALAVLIGVPLGILAALNERASRIMRPILDAMQTVPSTAYLVPAVLLFSIGQVPAAVATLIYALPPVVRLTALGIRQVPSDTVEAGYMFGRRDVNCSPRCNSPRRSRRSSPASTRRSTWRSASW